LQAGMRTPAVAEQNTRQQGKGQGAGTQAVRWGKGRAVGRWRAVR